VTEPPAGASTEDAESRPAPPDPWKGFRSVMAATLILESIVVLLTILVLTKFGNSGGRFGIGVVLMLAAAMILVCCRLNRPWALGFVLALQLVMVACGFLTFALGVLGVVFGLVWFALLMMRRDVARKMARGELPSQRA
jgi:Protein of unknown function (DUF4233)